MTLTCQTNGTDEECLAKNIAPCDSPENITQLFKLKKLLSGGKSGAYLFIVTYADQDYVLKFYPGTYAADGSVVNDRPLREMVTLCRMSGTEGYPCVFREGCSVAPTAWAPGIPSGVAPYVVMSFASGTTLSNLDLNAMTQEQTLGTLLQLLNLLHVAQQRIGPSFQHFDLHPDNIFVDLSQCSPTPVVLRTLDGSPFKVSCPKVQLIDFDLVKGELFEGTSVFSEELPEQANKIKGIQPVPERTIAFAIKWLGAAYATSVISATRGIANTDIRNWLVFVTVLYQVARAKSLDAGGPVLPPLQPMACNDPTECLTRNMALFKGFAWTRSGTVARPNSPASSAAVLSSQARKRALAVSSAVFAALSPNYERMTKLWTLFDRRVFAA